MATIELHVSVNGNDAHPGTRKKPVASLARARDLLREKRAAHGGTPPAPATVWIHEGDYVFHDSFELTEQDSGTAAAPVAYRAAKGERVRFIGGRIVTGFRPVTDPAVQARLDPAARGKVIEADLRALGIANLTPMRSRGFGRGSIPSHVELFFNTQPMTLARWPNVGDAEPWARITSFPADGGKNDGHGTILGKLENGFHYDGDRPGRWAPSDDIWVHGYWAYDWANSYERIASIDKAKRHITTHPPHGLYGINKNQRFYFLNVLEELDAPGEYYVDRNRGVLYFWPPADVADAEVMVSILEKPLIDMRNVSHVTLAGSGDPALFTLECTRGHGVQITDGSACLVAGLTLRNTGNYGAWITGGDRHGVLSCDIHHNGDGGVYIRCGDRKTLAPGHHFVDNCHFHHQALWSRCYFPAVLFHGVGARVSNCLIHDHPHCAVLFQGNCFVLERNEIHSVCQETGDVGAIYTGRDWTAREHIIRHNYLHDIHGPGHIGSLAIYPDDCAAGLHIHGNILHHTQIGVAICGGRDLYVDNNLFIDCTPAVSIDARGLAKTEIWQNMVNKFMKDRLTDMSHHAPPYSTRYPELALIDPWLGEGKGVPPQSNHVLRNIVLGGEGGIRFGWESRPDMVDVRDNWLEGDPGWVNPALEGDGPRKFALRDDAPVYRLGFAPLPLDKIGLRKDEYRAGNPQRKKS